MIKRLLIVVAAAALLSGCTSMSPTTSHIPRLEQQGDLEVAGSINVPSILDFNASAALSDHVAAQLAINCGSAPNLRPAVGLYWAQPHHTFSIYAGGDFGRTSSKHDLLNMGENNPDCDRSLATAGYDYHVSRFQQYFLQGEWAWEPRPWLQLAARLSAGGMHCYSWKEEGVNPFASESLKYNYIPDTNPCTFTHSSAHIFFLEPTLQASFGGPA